MALAHEIEKVWQCVVCGKAWDNRQSLCAHLKVHKGEGYLRTSMHVKKDVWLRFKAVCKDHKTTECQVLGQFIESAVAAEEKGINVILSQNPMLVQLNHIVLGAPRGRYSHVDVRSTVEALARGEWPPVVCAYLDGVSGQDVYCQKVGGSWLPRSACQGCGRNRLKG